MLKSELLARLYEMLPDATNYDASWTVAHSPTELHMDHPAGPVTAVHECRLEIRFTTSEVLRSRATSEAGLVPSSNTPALDDLTMTMNTPCNGNLKQKLTHGRAEPGLSDEFGV